MKPFYLTKPIYCMDRALATYIHSTCLFHWEQLLHGVNLLLANEVGDGYHWPLTPVLPFHHHPIAKQFQCRVLIDAVPLGYVRYKERLSREKQINWWRGRGRDTWGWMDKERRQQLHLGLKTLPSVSSALWSLTWKPPPPPPTAPRREQIFSLCTLNGWLRVRVADVNLPAGRL